MGYPPVLRAQPNPTHYALSALLHTSHIKNIITQNVDGLHLKASSLHVEGDDPRILQLHGSLHVRKYIQYFNMLTLWFRKFIVGHITWNRG